MALLVLFGVASLHVRQLVLADARYLMERPSLRLQTPEAALADAARDELEALRGSVEGRSLHDPALVPDLAASLRGLRWVETVERVGAALPATLTFELRTARAACRVRVGEHVIPVTSTGHPLPPRYLTVAPETLPIVEGFLPEAPGQRSDAERLHEALAHALPVILALRTSGLDGRLGLTSVDVSNLDGRSDPLASELLLRTRSGCLVEWGRSPVSLRPHLPLEEKLERLAAFLEAHPDLGAFERIALRWDRLTYVVAERAPDAGS
jgi:hypothetical protein